mgnify:CR=1 FL=1
MRTFIKLFSNKNGEINRFLEHFYSNKKNLADNSLLEWETSFENPIEMADMIGVFIDNIDDYKINMWVSLDENMLINVTRNNVDDLIRYLYERYPY